MGLDEDTLRIWNEINSVTEPDGDKSVKDKISQASTNIDLRYIRGTVSGPTIIDKANLFSEINLKRIFVNYTGNETDKKILYGNHMKTIFYLQGDSGKEYYDKFLKAISQDNIEEAKTLVGDALLNNYWDMVLRDISEKVNSLSLKQREELAVIAAKKMGWDHYIQFLTKITDYILELKQKKMSSPINKP